MYQPKMRRPTGLLARLDRATPWFQGLRTLKWMLGFALALILLPLASLWSPTLETAFGNQRWLAVGVSTVALLFASWGAMLCSSLRITAEQSRAQLRGEVRTDLMALEHLLELPITRFQRYLLHALAFPGVLVLVAGSPEPWRATLSAAAAVVFANVVGAILEESILPRGTSDDPGKQRGRFHRIVAGVITDRVRQVFEAIRRPVSLLVAKIGIQDILDDNEPPRVVPEHFLVICTAVLTFLVLFGIALLKQPPFDPDWMLSTPFLIFTVLALAIWTIGAFEFHLPRYGITPLAAIMTIVLIAGSAGLFVDHQVNALVKTSAQARWPTPVEVVAVSKQPKNLVVVCATGGGILAAGWTSLVLEKLIVSGAVDRDEIRLLSTVSGGSVGGLYSLLAWDAAANPDSALGAAVRGATRSSLPAVLYGMFFTDFARTLTLGASEWLFPGSRGQCLDDQWAQNAREEGLEQQPATLDGFVARIRTGELPLIIFNATAMETGRRVMISPLSFDGTDPASLARGQTLSEYMFGFDSNVDPKVSSIGQERVAQALEAPSSKSATSSVVDLPIWSAARLSATFPYLTPASRIALPTAASRIATERNTAQHHFIDGGYYDNYGVASALDFLEPVMQDFLSDEPKVAFERIAILEIRAFPTRDTNDAKPSSSFVAEVTGPIHGVTNIRDGAASSRNAIELSRFIERYQTKSEPNRPRTPRDLEIQSFVFEPKRNDSEDGPLSWSMTSRQIEAMQGNWEEDGENTGRRARQLREFLGHADRK